MSLHKGRWVDLNPCLFQLVAQEAQISLHLVRAPHLIGELALEGTHLWVQLKKESL